MGIRSTILGRERVMAVEVTKSEEIFGGGKNREGKEVNSAILRKRANRDSTNIKKRERGGVV